MPAALPSPPGLTVTPAGPAPAPGPAGGGLARRLRRHRRHPLGRMLVTADGVPISAAHLPAPASGALTRPGGADPPADGLGFVVAHGFTGSWRAPDVQAVMHGLNRAGGVVGFDFRGHGASGGRSTVGDREVLDLAVAVGWARLLGYRRLVTVGWSMGAAVAVRHAALHGGVDAVVAVSGPSRWHFRGTAAMRRAHRGIETRLGRAVLALAFDTRIATDGWDPPPLPPDALVGRIRPARLLLIHGDADHYFPLDHARWLARAAGDCAQLWVEPEFGHAESSADPRLLARIAAWAREVAAPSARMPG